MAKGSRVYWMHIWSRSVEWEGVIRTQSLNKTEIFESLRELWLKVEYIWRSAEILVCKWSFTDNRNLQKLDVVYTAPRFTSQPVLRMCWEYHCLWSCSWKTTFIFEGLGNLNKEDFRSLWTWKHICIEWMSRELCSFGGKAWDQAVTKELHES